MVAKEEEKKREMTIAVVATAAAVVVVGGKEKERRLSPSEGYVISACALVGRLSVAGTTYLTHCP